MAVGEWRVWGDLEGDGEAEKHIHNMLHEKFNENKEEIKEIGKEGRGMFKMAHHVKTLVIHSGLMTWVWSLNECIKLFWRWKEEV